MEKASGRSISVPFVKNRVPPRSKKGRSNWPSINPLGDFQGSQVTEWFSTMDGHLWLLAEFYAVNCVLISGSGNVPSWLGPAPISL